ncbi:Squalene and phytoene synthases family protein [Coccidioides posadasii C735 delta SOWgp]|uniref:Squalene and phytoene synthases family protein n=1 Tax=Coccidioides posadasii (strain C735) TaxID=222929 RepID=C5P0Y9_COCP7|nr:Squalene and phytoene synthases family protein [Coccidioides posadasii C735 delta SOWgp]EER29347.1 Squalene and phytoene synthases family protein [Coccidioides posadasii C735 delta SOWgp]|eukprot:XP_003071492.1 Squalene and phytoene synthases family protein [Coccidioides posadasii C735 delta SOWgp]
MTWRKPVHLRDESKESRNVKEFYRFLALTSRSFVAVCQELHPELLLPVVVFYLVLRSLDTIEDDMTIGIEEKEPLLRNFYTRIDEENWAFDGSGPDEKDREALVKFDCVAREFNLLKDEYRAIIKDIAKGMGNGMADYAKMADENANGLSVKTIKDYELYCHYVAGLVGELRGTGPPHVETQADGVNGSAPAANEHYPRHPGRLRLQTILLARGSLVQVRGKLQRPLLAAKPGEGTAMQQ